MRPLIFSGRLPAPFAGSHSPEFRLLEFVGPWDSSVNLIQLWRARGCHSNFLQETPQMYQANVSGVHSPTVQTSACIKYLRSETPIMLSKHALQLYFIQI